MLGQLCSKAGFTTSASSQGSSRVPCTGTSRGPASGGVFGVRSGRRGQGGSRRRSRGNSSGPSLGTPSPTGQVFSASWSPVHRRPEGRSCPKLLV